MAEENDTRELYFEELFEAVDHGERELFRELFLPLHERDQQELFHLLYPENKRKISEFLSAEEFAEIFRWMDFDDQKDAIKYLPENYLVSIFNYLPTDILANFVLLNRAEDLDHLFKEMDPKELKSLREIMSHESKTAGSIMTKEYFFIYEEETTQRVIEKIREFGERAETIYYLYVVDQKHHLVGVLSLRDLLLTPEDTKVQEVMNTQAVNVRVDQDQEEVANIIQDYDLIAIPVVTHDERLVGIITVDDIMDIVESEIDEDFQEFAGISASKTIETEKTSPLIVAKQRSPWIIILLFLSMITGGLISFFEATLASVVSLAAFIPLIMGAAGNVGTQSLAVTLRNMGNDEEDKAQNLRNILFREMQSGALIGLIAGVVSFGIVSALYQNLVLAFIVAVSIFLSITVAAVVGTLIPDLIQRLNFDPAVASGPFITTINDTLGLLIYFVIATTLIGLLRS